MLEHALEQTQIDAQTHNNHCNSKKMSNIPIERRNSSTKKFYKENVGQRQCSMPCQPDNVADNDWKTRVRLLFSSATKSQWKLCSQITHPALRQQVHSGMTSFNGQNDNMITIQHQVWIERVKHAHAHAHTLNEWKMIPSNQDVITITLNTLDSLTNRLNRFILQHHLHTDTDTQARRLHFIHFACFALNTLAYGTARAMKTSLESGISRNSTNTNTHSKTESESGWEGGRGVGEALFPYFPKLHTQR